MGGGSCWKQDLLETDKGQSAEGEKARGGTTKSSYGKRTSNEAGLGYLNLSSRGVKAEQVACGWDFGLSPSEQGRARGHFLGLQVLGGLQPWGRRKR